jgi:mono/diheme cytochrome c family protein
MRSKGFAVALAGGAMFAALLTEAVPVKITLPPETAKLKEGAGVELVKGQCLLCHSADYISTQPPLSGTAWKATVIKMRDKYGAPIVEDKIETLVEYLTANYGPAAGSAVKK